MLVDLVSVDELRSKTGEQFVCLGVARIGGTIAFAVVTVLASAIASIQHSPAPAYDKATDKPKWSLPPDDLRPVAAPAHVVHFDVSVRVPNKTALAE